MKIIKTFLAAAVPAAAAVAVLVTISTAEAGGVRTAPASSASGQANSAEESSAAERERKVTPKYLPAGSQRIGRENRANGSGHAEYSLSGRVNANTIPPEGVTSANATRVHPATTIVVAFVPGVTELPQLPVNASYFESRRVSIGGHSATLSVPKSGVGPHRLDWVDDDGYHVVLTDRLATPEGLSGVDGNELRRIAESLYD